MTKGRSARDARLPMEIAEVALPSDPTMKLRTALFIAAALVSRVHAQTTPTRSDIPYIENGHERQVLDIHAPPNARNLPVVFWIHGGGWQAGDKGDVKLKPQWFMDKGFVFVSTNYRLLPGVDMGTLIRDVAKSFAWVQKHIAEYGGDPRRVLVGGHSAGAQLAAILCTDDRYLKAGSVSFAPNTAVAMPASFSTMPKRCACMLVSG